MRKNAVLSLAVAAGVLSAGVIAAPVMAETKYQATIGLPGTMTYDPSFTCDNKGSNITLTGNITINKTLPVARIELWNSPPGSKTAVLQNAFSVSLQDENGGNLYDKSPKQPSLGGVGGNPYFWFALDGQSLSQAQFLGRCVEQSTPRKIARNFNQGAILSLALSQLDCNNTGGPNITITAGRNENAVIGNVIESNNYKGTLQSADIKAQLGIVFENGKIMAPKSVAAGGAGGNPIVKVQFLQCMNYDSDHSGSLSDAEITNCAANHDALFDGVNRGTAVTTLSSGVRCNKL
jgi:hypothetical protein